MINYIKAFGQVERAEKSELLVVSGGEDMVGYGDKRGFCGEGGAETVLG